MQDTNSTKILKVIRSNFGYLVGSLIIILVILKGCFKQAAMKDHGVYSVGHVIMRHGGGKTSSISYEYLEKGRRYVRRQDVTATRVLPSEYYLIIVDSLNPSKSLLLGDHPLAAEDTSRNWRSVPIDKDLISIWKMQ